MRYKVVFFTRSGSSQRIAEKIAAKLSCKTVEVTDNMNWKGIVGFVKGGFYAPRTKKLKLK